MHLGMPVDVKTRVIEALRVQSVDRSVRELAPPLVGDHHATILRATARSGNRFSVGLGLRGVVEDLQVGQAPALVAHVLSHDS